MLKFCINCGAEIAEGKKFCTNCGAKAEEIPQAQSAPVHPQELTQQSVTIQSGQPIQTASSQQFEPAPSKYIVAANAIAADERPSKKSKYAPISTLGYIGWMILMSIPVAGWIIAGLFAFGKTGSVNRRNLARAMLVFIIIFVVAVGASLIIYWPVLVELSKYVHIDFGF